ncbi:MAG: hypothetical protein ABUL58_07530, partial [Steroidobacter sp.]
TVDTAKLKWMTASMKAGITTGFALIVPLLSAIEVLVLNIAAILFPAWMQNNPGGPGGIEVMGQRILFAAGMILAVVVALLPAVLFAGLAWLLTQWLLGAAAAITFATVVFMGILIVEIVFSIQWLGIKFEQFDLSAEMRA